VGDRHYCPGILGEMPLQPGDRLRIQVVGRLVEQQQVRLLEQQPAQCDPALLSA